MTQKEAWYVEARERVPFGTPASVKSPVNSEANKRTRRAGMGFKWAANPNYAGRDAGRRARNGDPGTKSKLTPHIRPNAGTIAQATLRVTDRLLAALGRKEAPQR